MRRSLIPFFLLLGGCYGYYPVTGTAPAGREVEVTLTDSGSVVLARQIGAGVSAVSGHVTSDSVGSIVMALTGTRNRDGQESGWKGEQLVVARPLIAAVAERRFSRARTGLFGGILGVTLYALREALGGSGYGSGGSGLPGGSGRK